MPRLFTLLLCLLIGHAPGFGAAQVDADRWKPLADTVFKHHAGDDLQMAQAMAQDGQGFLWVGSSSGLQRWDGHRWRLYTADPRNPNALPGTSVAALHGDAGGRLWVGTHADGLARYEPATDGFVAYRAAAGAPASRSVLTIAAAGPGALWVGTGAGLRHLDITTGVQRDVPIGAAVDGAIKAVLQDADGGVWVGTGRGLLHRPAGSTAFGAVPLRPGGGASAAVTQLRRDSAGRLWIGARPDGVFVLEPGARAPLPLPHGTAAALLRGAGVLALVEATPGVMWVGTYGGGIVVVEPDSGWRARRLRHHAALPTTLRDDDVLTLYRDRGGLMWVASTLALSVHDPTQRTVATLFGTPTRDRPVPSVQVPFVLPVANGRIWLSGADGGVAIIDPGHGRVGEFRPDAARPLHALPPGRVLAMAAAPGGDVYLGTHRGLYRADAAGRRVWRVAVPQRAADAMVWALTFDAGVLWMGGVDGLWALDVAAAGPPRLVRHHRAVELGNARVTAIARGDDDTLWVGTAEGLNRLDLATHRIEQVQTDSGDPHGLLAGYAAAILFDDRRRLWLASVGSGIQVLERFDAAGRPRFRRIGTRDGLPHSSVNKLLLAGDGTVWASTDNGLAVIDPATFAVRALGEADGVAIRSYWSNAGAVTAAGELLFGGIGGLTVVRPGEREPVRPAPPVVVTEARAGGRALVASSFNAPTPEAPVPRLQIGPGERSLMVEFAALDFAAPATHGHSHRLQGFDDDWIPTEASRRLASYTNLPPGDYTLRLRASRPGQTSAAQVLDLPLTVLPAWYQTTGFRVAAAAAAVLLVAALVQLRTLVLQRRQRELQALVALRTAELRASQAKLEKIAYFDPLTGLANRRRFNDELRQQMLQAQHGGPPVTLLLVDLDRFKQINDTFGHDAGDAMLVELAQRLRNALRQPDRVARLGGDEFAVLLADSSAPDALETACSRIGYALSLPLVFGRHLLEPSASIGAAHCPTDATEPDALYKCADLALYAAKRAGRGTWRCHAPGLAPSAATDVPDMPGAPSVFAAVGAPAAPAGSAETELALADGAEPLARPAPRRPAGAPG